MRAILSAKPWGDLRRAVLVTVAAHGLLLVVGYLAVTLIGFDGVGAIPPPVSENQLLDLPARWDAAWYVGLAHGGYRWRGQDARFENVAFFPAYPFTIWLVAGIARVPATSVAWTWIGVFVSNVTFVAALLYLQRLSRSFKTAVNEKATTWLIAFYPFSIFYGLPYTEALYVLAAIAAFWHLTVGDYFEAMLWGVVLGLTRPNGFVVAAPLLMVAASRRHSGAMAASLAPVAGMLIYSAFVYHLTGHPFAWATSQAGWGREVQNPVRAFTQVLREVHLEGAKTILVEKPHDLLNAASVVLAGCAIWPVSRQLGVPYSLFMALNVSIPLIVGGLPSMGRYTSVLFPMFIWMGAASRRAVVIVCGVFISVYVVVAALFFLWRPVF